MSPWELQEKILEEVWVSPLHLQVTLKMHHQLTTVAPSSLGPGSPYLGRGETQRGQLHKCQPLRQWQKQRREHMMRAVERRKEEEIQAYTPSSGDGGGLIGAHHDDVVNAPRTRKGPAT